MNVESAEPQNIILQDKIPKKLFLIEQFSHVTSNISFSLQNNETQNTYCNAKTRYHQDYFNYYIRKILKNDMGSSRKKRQIAFLIGTILGFSVESFLNHDHNSIHYISTDFQEKLNIVECSLLQKIETLESRQIEQKIQTEIINFKNQLDEVFFQMKHGFHSSLTKNIFEKFCAFHSYETKPCLIFAMSSKANLKNKFINFEPHKIEVILEYQIYLPIKFRTEKIRSEQKISIPFFNENAEKWLVQGENSHLLKLKNNETIYSEKCLKSEEIFVCNQNTQKIAFDQITELALTSNDCFIEKYENFIIAVKPKNLVGNYTTLSSTSEILKSNNLLSSQIIKFSNETQKITIFCNNRKSTYYADIHESFQYHFETKTLSNPLIEENYFFQSPSENNHQIITLISIISVTTFSSIAVLITFALYQKYRQNLLKKVEKNSKSKIKRNQNFCSICSICTTKNRTLSIHSSILDETSSNWS